MGAHRRGREVVCAALVAATLALGCAPPRAPTRPPSERSELAAFRSPAALERWLEALVRWRNEAGPRPLLERVDDELRGPGDVSVRAFTVRADRAVLALGCEVFEARVDEDGLAVVGQHRVAPPSSRCPPAHRSGDSILLRVERPFDGAEHVVEVVRVALREPWGLETVESVELRFPERPASLDALAGFFGRFALVSGPVVGGPPDARRIPWPAMRRSQGPWRPWPDAERVFFASAPAGDPWAHVLVACEVRTSLECRSAGLIATEGPSTASGPAVFVAEPSDGFTRLYRLTLEGAGSVRAPGRLPGAAFDVSEADGRVRTLLLRDGAEGIAPILVDAPVARFASPDRALASADWSAGPAFTPPADAVAVDARFAGDVVAYGARTSMTGFDVSVSRGAVTRSVGAGVLRGLGAVGPWTWIGLGSGHAPVQVLDEDLSPVETAVHASITDGGTAAWETSTPDVWVTATAGAAHVLRRDGQVLRPLADIALDCEGEASCLRSVVALNGRTFLVLRNEVIEVRVDGDEVRERHHSLRVEAP